MKDVLLSSISMEDFEKMVYEAAKKAVKEVTESSKNFDDLPEFLTVKQVAQLLNISRPTVYLWIKQKKLKAYQLNGNNRFKKSEIINSLPTLVKHYR